MITAICHCKQIARNARFTGLNAINNVGEQRGHILSDCHVGNDLLQSGAESKS